MEFTCCVFSINVMTFQNWIKQKMYYGKWVHYVESFTVSDILLSIPLKYREKYNDVETLSTVKVPSKFHTNSSQLYISALSTGNRQSNQNVAQKNLSVTYLSKTTKSVGSGRKIKYEEQETFIVEAIVVGWETGNPLSKNGAYDLLLCKFGHEHENDRTEWEEKMKVHSGNISPNFSQWLSRVLQQQRVNLTNCS